MQLPDIQKPPLLLGLFEITHKLLSPMKLKGAMISKETRTANACPPSQEYHRSRGSLKVNANFAASLISNTPAATTLITEQRK
jgi:hypothetical protein